MRRINQQKGFSLIELLVVIAIAGIIIAVAAASYTTAQRQARDSRRIQDMKTIQAAFEQYFVANGVYPNSADGTINAAFQNTAPTDPKNSTYNFQTSQTAYCVCATLESSTGNANAPSSTTCNWSDNGSHYCVQNQQ